MLSGSYSASYQSNYADHYTISAFLEYFPILFEPIFKFVSPHYFFTNFFTNLLPLISCIVTFLALSLCPNIFSSKQMWVAISIGLGCVFLAILPEISVPVFLNASGNKDPDLITMRLEFLPGPFQAIVIASLTGLMASLFRSKYFFSAGIGLIVAFSVADSLNLQKNNGLLNPYLDLQQELSILRNAAPLINKSPHESTIFFIIPDDEPSPFGYGYHPFQMSCLLFGRPAYAGHFSSDFGIRHRVSAYPSPIDQANNYAPLVGIKNLTLLTVDNKGNVTDTAASLRRGLISSEHNAGKTNGPLGPCTIDKAKRTPAGDLPYVSYR